MRARFAVLSLICLALFASGCGLKPAPPSAQGTGVALVTIAVPGAASKGARGLDFPITKVVASLTKGATVKTLEAAPTASTVAFRFADLPTGQWSLTVKAIDSGGFTSHSASTTLTVSLNETTTVQVALRQETAGITLSVDTKAFADAGIAIGRVSLGMFTNEVVNTSTNKWSMSYATGIRPQSCSPRVIIYGSDRPPTNVVASMLGSSVKVSFSPSVDAVATQTNEYCVMARSKESGFPFEWVATCYASWGRSPCTSAQPS